MYIYANLDHSIGRCFILFLFMLVWDLISLLFFAWIPSHTDVLRLVQLNYIDNSFITILLFMYHSIDLYSLSRSMVYNSLYDFIILELIPRVCSHKRLLGYDILAFKWTIVGLCGGFRCVYWRDRKVRRWLLVSKMMVVKLIWF